MRHISVGGWIRYQSIIISSVHLGLEGWGGNLCWNKQVFKTIENIFLRFLGDGLESLWNFLKQV